MPIFFFDYDAGVDGVRDAHGRDVASVEAARAVALKEARSLIAWAVRHGDVDLRAAITIRNESLEVLARISFEEAVVVRGI